VTAEPARELSLIEMAVALLRHGRVLILTPFIVVGIAITLLVIRGSRFSADSAFRPQVSETSANRFAGLAAQLGVTVPGTSIGDPVKFYAEVAKSRDVLREVALTEYRFASAAGGEDSVRGNLLALFRIRGKTQEDAMRRVLNRLAKQVDVTTNRDAGLVRVRVVTPWSELSVLINRRILGLIDTANLVRRQSQAGAERRFIETRLTAAQAELESAERDQERFLAQNRQYQSSPQLLLEFNRLQRRVDLRQQVYATLAQGYEQARIDEVRDTPQLTIIDRPEGSARPVGSLVADAAMWLLIGGVLGVMLALAQEFLARQRAQDPAGYEELRELAARQLTPSRRVKRS